MTCADVSELFCFYLGWTLFCSLLNKRTKVKYATTQPDTVGEFHFLHNIMKGLTLT